MREDGYQLNELQQAGLNILKVFITICKKYELTYYIYGGSLLGAIRHKGFIPWDDDVDIAMPRKDFEKFKEIQNELPDYMYLDTVDRKGHCWTPARIMDTRMVLETGFAVNRANMNVWMDILIIDGVPSPKTLKFKLFSFLYLTARLIYKFSNFSNEVDLQRKRNWYETFFVKFALVTHIEKIIPQVLAGRFLDWVSRRYDMDKCEYCATLSGALKMDETQPKYWFGTGRPLQFEDITINAMTESEKFLVKIYGEDYMTPPPPEKRNQHNIKIISSSL